MFFYKKRSPKLIFLNDFFLNSFNFWRRNWLWKYNLGTFWQTIIHCRIVLKQFPLSMSIVWQKSCILGPTIFKFHNRTDINEYIFQHLKKLLAYIHSAEWWNIFLPFSSKSSLCAFFQCHFNEKLLTHGSSQMRLHNPQIKSKKEIVELKP